MTIEPVVETARDEIRKRSPPWLRIGNNERLLYTLGLHIDTLTDALVAGVKSRFPGLYSDESIPLIGRERRIARGRDETTASYIDRLRMWRIDHRRRGNPYALLSQLHISLGPSAFPIDLLYANGRRFLMDADGNIERSFVPWLPDDQPERWARWWLFYNTDQWAVTPPTQSEIDELRAIPRAWNTAHALGYIVLFPSDAQLWNYPPGHTWNEAGVWNTTGPDPRFITVDDDV